MLLQQLQLTEDVYMSFFEEGELTRLTVHKKNRLWCFSLKLKTILPSIYTNYCVRDWKRSLQQSQKGFKN